MNITQIKNSSQLREFMATPTAGLIDSMQKIKGDILVLGGSGKMGPELVEMIARADRQAGIKRKMIVASTFSNPKEKTQELFNELGVRVYKGDLSDKKFLESLPDAQNGEYWKKSTMFGRVKHEY